MHVGMIVAVVAMVLAAIVSAIFVRSHVGAQDAHATGGERATVGSTDGHRAEGSGGH
jgi:hypothetical protein